MNPLIGILTAVALVLGDPSGTHAHPRTIVPEAREPEFHGNAATGQVPRPIVTTAASSLPSSDAVASPEPATARDARAGAPDRATSAGPAACGSGKHACRNLMIAGLVLGTLGLAAVGTGAGLVATPNKAIPGEPAYEISYEPPGVVLMGMGIGMLGTAILMLIAGRKRTHARTSAATARARARARAWNPGEARSW